MLVIRDTQIEQMLAPDAQSLVSMITSAVRSAVGDQLDRYDDEQLSKMMAIGIERARSYGLENADDLASFVAVMFEIAPRFDEQPAINAALSFTELPTARMRFDYALNSTPDDAWVQAGRNYEDTFWFEGGAKI